MAEILVFFGVAFGQFLLGKAGAQFGNDVGPTGCNANLPLTNSGSIPNITANSSYNPPGIPGGNENERMTEKINEKNKEKENWSFRLEEKARQARLRREVEEQKRQENLNKSYIEENKLYEEKKEKNLQKLSSTDDKFKENMNLPKDDCLVSKNDEDIYGELDKYVKEHKNINKKHNEEMNYIQKIPLMNIRVSKFEEEKQRFRTEMHDYWNNLYKKIQNDIGQGQMASVKARADLAKTAVDGMMYVIEGIKNAYIDGSTIIAENNRREAIATNQLIKEHVTVDRMVTTTSVVNDIANLNPGGIALTVATAGLSELNDSYCKQSKTEQNVDTTIGAVALGMGLIAGAGISAPVTVPLAVGTTLLLPTKEGLKTLYHLDNQVREHITKDAKNETEKQLILQQHERGKIGCM